jgi:FkbM family methyltransferase
MTYLSFTRNREDVLIMRALQYVERGFYVDVGAFQPMIDSNTFALYQRGWRGIVVEPQRRLHALWERDRPRDIMVGVAIGASEGMAHFHEFAGMEQNATTDSGVAAMHQADGHQASCTSIPRASLTSLLEQHRPDGDIHLLSVDVEGAERAVLEGLDLKRFRPWLVVMESTVPNRSDPSFAGWEGLLLEQGYVFAYFDAVNRFYLADEHRDLQPYFAYPPCVWDDFIDYRLHQAQQAARSAESELAELRASLRKPAE